MIWHIFQKDLRLMWPFVAGLITVAAIQCGLNAEAGTVIPTVQLNLILQILPIAIMLGVAVITVMVVQQDNLLGDRHDWLLRPISSRRVLAAKVLFVILAVHGPLFLIDILGIVAMGISLRQSLIPALSHQAVLFVLATTPALVVGATTRNFVTAVGLGAGTLILIILIFLIANFGFGINPSGTPIESGYAWVATWTTFAIYVAIFFCLAWFQYRERRERRSQIIGLTTSVAAFALLCGFPWGAAIKAQQWIDTGTAGGNALSLAFPAKSSPQSISPASNTGERNGVLSPFKPGRDVDIMNFASGIHMVTLPVLIAGLPGGDVILSDRATFRIESPNGTGIFKADGPVCFKLDRGGVSGSSCAYAVLRGHRDSTDASTVRGDFLLPLPTAVYKRIKDQPIRIRVNFTVTLLQHNASQFMHAVNDRKMVKGIGLCTTGVDQEGDDIELRCVTAVHQPACIGATLADMRTGSRNPLLFGCNLDYAPFPYAIPPELLKRRGADLPFLDLDGLAHYPVGSAQVGEAQVVIDTFVPSSHLNRSLDIQAVRLSDWEKRATKRGA